MNRAASFLVVASFLVCLSLAQNGDEPKFPGPPGGLKDAAGVDAFVQGKVAPKTLSECQAYALEWQAWYKYNGPICERLRTDYAALVDRHRETQAENERLSGGAAEIRLRIFVAFVAVGFGAFLAFLVSRGVRRAWPLSFEHKQLAVLVMVAAWISIAALIAVSDSRFSYHPVNSAFRVGVWSLPALVFGAVGFWWFGKKHPRRLF